MSGRQPEYGYMYGGRGGTGAPTPGFYEPPPAAAAPAPLPQKPNPWEAVGNLTQYTDDYLASLPPQPGTDRDVATWASAPPPNYQQTPGGAVNMGASTVLGADTRTRRYGPDPLAYVLGRDPNFIPQLSAATQATANQGAAFQQMAAGRTGALAQQAQDLGYGYAGQLQNYAGASAQMGDIRAGQLASQSATALNAAGAAQGRGAPQTDFGLAQGALGHSQGLAGQLTGLEAQQGPSAAQAMLTMGTDQAMASQLALARSGRGFGQDATAMGMAQQNNAATALTAANQAAVLRAQEEAAWRQRQAANLATGAGINQAAAQQFAGQSQFLTQAQQQQQINDQYSTNLYGLGMQGTNSAGQLGLQGYAQAAGIAGQAGGMAQGGLTLAGQLEQAGAGMHALGTSQLQQGYQTAGQLAQAQAATAQARDQLSTQIYGIDKGVQVAQQQANQQLIGAGISGGAAVLGGLIAGPPGAAAGGTAGNAAYQYGRG